MNTLINEPVYQSKNSDKVVLFLNETEIKPEIVKAIENATIEAIYYNDAGNIVARDIWQDIHQNILL